MNDTLNQILSVDEFTWWVVGVLTIWAAMIIRHSAESTALTLLYLPGLAAGALLGIWGLREYEIILSFVRDSNVIMSAGLGMCAMLVLMLIATRLTFVASGALIRARQRRHGIAGRMSGA